MGIYDLLTEIKQHNLEGTLGYVLMDSICYANMEIFPKSVT